MPTSAQENKNVVIKWFKEIRPDTMIDIGPGEGTYSDLLKPYKFPDDMWTGIEAWGPYVTQYKLNKKYNEVIVADVTYVNPVVFEADLVIAGDVLEHIEKEDCKELIQTILEHADNLIISVPVLHLDQGAYEGNWFENHIGHWHYEEMLEFLDEIGATVRESVKGKILAYFWVEG